MTPAPYTPRDPEWHDHSVAAAATAWLSDPRDTEAYRRLVTAVLRRRGFLEPTLDTLDPDTPEVLDDVGSDRAPQRIADAVDHLMANLRHQQPEQPH